MEVLPAQVPVLVHPPKIARVAAVIAGLTTVADFERHHGRGLVSTGGHSGGARTWYVSAYHLLIHVDGFNYSARGEVIDSVDIDWSPSAEVGKGVPSVRLSPKEFGLAKLLRPHMKPAQVESVLHLKLRNGVATQSGKITYSKKLVNKEDHLFSAWRLECTFDRTGLSSFRVSCD